MNTAVPFELRPAIEADREWIYVVKRAAMKDHVAAVFGWDESVQRRMFDDSFDPQSIQIIRSGGYEVGLLQTERRGDHVFLARIELLPDAQSKGLGTSVVSEVIKKAETIGLPVRLQVFRKNPASRLYQRLGFRPYAESATHVKMERRPNKRVEDSAGLPPPSSGKSTAIEHRLPGVSQP